MVMLGLQLGRGSVRSESARREAALRQHIEALRRDGPPTCLLRPRGQGKGSLALDPGTTPGQSRDGSRAKDEQRARVARENSLLLHDLDTVGEEMAERSAETHLAEEELRCLDWALQALKAQDSPPARPLPPPARPLPPPARPLPPPAHPLPPQSPRVEPRQRAKAEPQLPTEQAHNGHITRPQNKENLEELHVMFQRDHGLKKRLSLVRESLATALRDSAPRRRDSDEHKSRRAAGSNRSSRRRYQEQVWRLEQKLAVMSESHQSQIAGLKATVEALESRREETAL